MDDLQEKAHWCYTEQGSCTSGKGYCEATSNCRTDCGTSVWEDIEEGWKVFSNALGGLFDSGEEETQKEKTSVDLVAELLSPPYYSGREKIFLLVMTAELWAQFSPISK